MDRIEQYAIGLVHEGAEHAATDDMDEDGVFGNEADWRAACDMAGSMARALRDNAESFIAWYHTVGGLEVIGMGDRR
jgi:hypothetical protein